jgi:putative hydrolase of the HAD superfamily
MPIQNLIIDLGGVLYAIDPERAIAAFRSLIPAKRLESLPQAEKHQIGSHRIFFELEKGTLDPPGFRAAMRSEMGVEASDEEIDQAWNALLRGVIPGRIADLQSLADRYRLVLLSNTNLIHAQAFSEEVRPLFACFERCYLSYEMGMRKPELPIYQTVLQESNMDAAGSLFVDDSEANIEGGKKAGLQTFHFSGTDGQRWKDLMKMLIG